MTTAITDPAVMAAGEQVVVAAVMTMGTMVVMTMGTITMMPRIAIATAAEARARNIAVAAAWWLSAAVTTARLLRTACCVLSRSTEQPGVRRTRSH